jgi:hypothetical protein
MERTNLGLPSMCLASILHGFENLIPARSLITTYLLLIHSFKSLLLIALSLGVFNTIYQAWIMQHPSAAGFCMVVVLWQ